MSFATENDFEQFVINKLVANGYEYIDAHDILKLRNNDMSIVLIEEHIRSFLKTKYKISDEHFNRVILKLNQLKDSSLVESNKEFHKCLAGGIKVFDEKLQKTVSYKVIDFENPKENKFVVTNQFIMNTKNPMYTTQRPDIVVFINGLPISVFELKSPTSLDDKMEDAFKQVSNYQVYLQDLFVYNAFNVISNFVEAKFGSITSPFARYQYWRGKEFSNQLVVDSLLEDLFSKNVLLDVIENYTFFIEKQNPIKIVASYHQYYGVKESLSSIQYAMDNETKKGGIFWHTQGAGKSYSMVFLVKNYSMIKPGTTYLVITDRNDLDNQLHETFETTKNFLGHKIHQIESIKELNEKLSGIQQDGVYFITVQKFTKDYELLSKRKDIVIITDEAHRSHTNIEGNLYLDDFEVTEKFGNAKYLRESFPNATFIGFTGTPIEKDDKSTSSIFGDPITKYLMADAERDGVIVPIKYESRKPKLHFNLAELNLLDEYTSQVIKEIDKTSTLSSEVRKKINKIAQSLENFIKDEDRVNGIVDDFIEHYNSRKDVVLGKAMFVAYDRQAAFNIYKRIIKVKPEFENITKLVVTNANGQNDSPELIELSGTPQYRKKLATEFKKDDSDFKIAIVVDMWLTGFDVPSLDMLYLDKPIKMHNLMQTIARTNRVYTNKRKSIFKECGIVVDYIGVWAKLKEALEFYSGLSEDGENRPTSDLEELKKIYLNRLDLHYKNYIVDTKIDFDKLLVDGQYRLEMVRKVHNEVSKAKKIEPFVIHGKVLNTYIKEIVSVLDARERLKFNFILVTRAHMIKVALADVDFTDIKKRILEQLEKAVDYENTEVIDELDGNTINLGDIIKFIQKASEDGNVYAEKDEKVAATKKLITELRRINIVKSRKISEELQKLMNKYDSNFITLEELMEGLYLISVEALEIANNSKDISTGYTQEEMAFFNIFLTPSKVREQYDDESIKKIVNELLVIINDNKLVNETWVYNDSMKQKVRSEIKKLLAKYDYPPEGIETTPNDIVEQIINQKGYTKGE